jgi:hypothetical protein
MTMAYVNFADGDGAADLRPSLIPATVAVADGRALSQREWMIVQLARDDGLASLREEHRFSRFMRMIFGIERKTPYANPRFEALRRLAVMSWHHGYNVNSREIPEFLSAGYSIEHYDAMLAHIGRERAASARRPRR